MTDIIFSNYDKRIQNYHLLLERDLNNLPCFPLPEGYRFVFYRQGDRDTWIQIEKSAGEFESYDEGLEAWNTYYAAHEDELGNRMVFIETEDGEKIATATAYYDVIDHDPSGDGWLHWVAVRSDFQGRGLSKPLISHVLGILRKLGYTHAKIPTQSRTWVACRIYLNFGFLPVPENAVESRKGWEIMKALTNHPALGSFEAASMEDILKRG